MIFKMKAIDCILIALVATGAITAVVVCIICLYIFAVYTYADNFLSNLNERVFEGFSKLIRS